MGIKFAAVTSAAIIAFSGASSSSAEASATGFQSIGNVGFSTNGLTFKVPTGCTIGHSIRGSGKRINQEWAGVTCAPPASSYLAFHKAFCNTRIDFIYKDTRNRIYSRYTGPTRRTCYGATIPDTKLPAPRTLARYGTACAALYISGRYISQQCHYIN